MHFCKSGVMKPGKDSRPENNSQKSENLGSFGALVTPTENQWNPPKYD